MRGPSSLSYFALGSLLLLLLQVHGSLGQGDRCETLFKEEGVCTGIKQCPYMLNLLITQKKDPQVLDYLRRSSCFVRGTPSPTICCPRFPTEKFGLTTPAPVVTKPPSRGCLTSRNEEGNCLNIRQCSPMLDLLRKNPRAPETIEYIRMSTCVENTRTVCCPSNPIQGTSRPPVPVTPSVDFRSKFLSLPECGVPEELPDDDRIIGGKNSTLGAWPWVAALGYPSSRNNKILWRCGGALINSRYVLTAAHCIKESKVKLEKIRLGDLDLNDSVRDNAKPIDYRIRNIIVHEGYSSLTKFNDIALIELAEEVEFNDLIKPICLPWTKEMRTKDYMDKTPTVVGWGVTNTATRASATRLQEVKVDLVSNRDCAIAYRNVKATRNSTVVIIPQQLCAGNIGEGPKKDACQGDSGGPLVTTNAPGYVLIGVVSYGNGCAVAGYPGVYTRVTEYIDWIARNTN